MSVGIRWFDGQCGFTRQVPKYRGKRLVGHETQQCNASPIGYDGRCQVHRLHPLGRMRVWPDSGRR